MRIDALFPRDDIAYAVMLNTCQKVVYSKTLQELTWSNSRQVMGNLQRIVGMLKAPRQGPEKNILVYGSGRLVSALMQEELVDEYHLWVHPVVLGKCVPLFRNEQMKLMLEQQQMQPFKSGVIWFRFFVNKNLSPAGG